MTAPDRSGAVLLVELDPGTLADELRGWPGLPEPELLAAAELAARLVEEDRPIGLVVIGTRPASAAVALTQRVHQQIPDAAIVLLADDVEPIRRQASYAPGVPLDLLVATSGEPDLLGRLARLHAAVGARRRHAAVLAAVARTASAAEGDVPPAQTAVGALLEHAPLGVLVTGATGDLLGWNRRAEALLQLGPDRAGQAIDDVLPGALALVHAAASTGLPGASSDTSRPPLQLRVADRIDVELSAVSSQTDRGRPVVLLLAVDVTAHRAAEQERDRLAGQVQLLGQVSELLMESLDPEPALARLADALAPAFADWVSVAVHDEHDRLVRVAESGANPAVQPAIELDTQVTEFCRRAGGGEQLLLSRPADGGTASSVGALLDQLGAASVVAVPIPGRSEVLGSLLLARGAGRTRFTGPDLGTAVEIGRRTGLALDNARLYLGQRDVATELQRSLLTDPPRIPFADIAVRYVAAAQEAQVGGDWYDAFRARNGDLLVVIGDVVGHDTRAAAAMGQLRALLRGIAFVVAEAPGRALTRFDEAIAGLELGTVATAVLARLTPSDAGGLRVRWSNAGHPVPLLLDAAGRVRPLEADDGRADLLLGVDATRPRRTMETVLPAGATLLLYTDGLMERREWSLDEGLDALVAAVEEHADADLEVLCDAVLRSMVPQAGEDDVAIVAVRPS